MFAVPTRRLLVYAAAGVAVLIVGLVGIACLRKDSGAVKEDVVAGKEGLVVRPVSSNPTQAADDASALQAASSTCLSSTSTSVPTKIYVQVAGAVRRPGVYQLPAQARVFEAIMAAGGFTEEADQDAVAQAAPLCDGCRVLVPRKGTLVQDSLRGPELSSAGVSSVESADSTGRASPESGSRVSLNRATAAELETLPGIGPSLAERIVKYREANGAFQSVEELLNVPGIGPAKLEQVRPYVGL